MISLFGLFFAANVPSSAHISKKPNVRGILPWINLAAQVSTIALQSGLDRARGRKHSMSGPENQCTVALLLCLLPGE